MLRVRPWPVESFEFDSKALRGNPLGDLARRELAVVLPPRYHEEPARRYPVVWVLTGFFGTGRMALNRSFSSPGLDERVARLAAEGKLPPALYALPDCLTALGGSQYLDSPGTGRYETYLCDELVPAVDARYRTIPRRGARALVGKSSGGYGALRLAMRRPDLFGAAASHSGDCGFEICHVRDFPVAAQAIAKAGGVKRLVSKVLSSEKPSHTDMVALMTIAMAACYSPNPRKPGRLKLDLPFDVDTGQVLTRVLERWFVHDPLRMVDVPDHARALRSLRLLYLDCGTRDQWFLHLGLRAFVAKLRRRRIPFVHEEFDDDHMAISYRYDRSLPLLVGALERD